jgi:hypothetical protein
VEAKHVVVVVVVVAVSYLCFVGKDSLAPPLVVSIVLRCSDDDNAARWSMEVCLRKTFWFFFS